MHAPDDAMDVDRKRGADWPHWPDRGSGPTRRDRLERRLFRDSEREAEIAAASETLRRIEQAAAAKAAEVERLEHAVGRLNGNGAVPAEALPAEAVPAEAVPAEAEAEATYLVFVWTPRGYALRDCPGDVPDVGSRLHVNGSEYAVAKLARSPLPGDGRRCAYLEPL